MRKKLVALLLIAAPVLVACRSTAPVQQGGTPLPGGGASSPVAAAELFLAAARAQDLQAMGLIWGTENGPARGTMDPNDMERRQVVMMCHLRHGSHRIVDETSLLQGQRRVTVDLTAGTMTRRTNITAVPAKNGAWYVLAVDLEPLRDICATRR